MTRVVQYAATTGLLDLRREERKWMRIDVKDADLSRFELGDSGTREASVENVASWLPTIHRYASCVCRPWEKADIASDVALRLVEHVRAGKAIYRFSAFVRCLVLRSVARSRRANRVVYGSDADAFIAPEAAESEVPADARVPLLVASRLRGARQRWFVQRVAEGWTAAALASELGWRVTEVERQINELAVTIRGGCGGASG